MLAPRLQSLLLVGLIGSVAWVGSRAAAEEPPNPAITSAELIDHVRRLASDEWEGRGTGSAGEAKATEYIAAFFARLGLEPAGIDGTWFQPVSMPGGFELSKGCALEIKGVEGAAAATLAVDKEWRPFSASSNGVVEGEAVFAGYGVVAPEVGGYDDYAGADVSGKVVFVFRHLPPGKRWSAGPLRAKHAPFLAKLREAAKRGAIGLVVVNDPFNFPGPGADQAGKTKRRPRPDALQRRGIGAVQGPRIPYAHMTLAAARKVFPSLFGATPDELQKAVVDSGAPVSRAGRARVRLAVELTHKTLTGRNVCALLRAESKEAVDEILVVGGHHDHLGRGMAGSLARGAKQRSQIHNGADDNASGTSGVLEVAAYMAVRRAHLRRSILFMTFTGEERGLVGSRHFVEHPTVPLGKIVAMINMDMIGRLEGRKLFIGGVKTSPVFLPVIKRINETIELDIVPGAGGRAPSDNTSFYMKNKPVLFFFTGMHPDYHRPSDDWDKVDGEGMERVVRLAAGVVDDLARETAPIPFRKVDGGGFGPPRAILGISVGPAEFGVTVARLSPNSPAARAGIVRGDVIVELAGVEIKDMRALMGAMAKRTIGEKVKVKVLRGGRTLEFEVKLGKG